MRATGKIKRPDDSSKLVLKEIIGLTTKNCNGLASNISSASCVYVAGCVAVVYNVDSGIQSHLMVSYRKPKPLSCVAVSPDGRFIAAGESGTQPAILLWDIANHVLVSELKGHLYGVECVAFSPDEKHLVSVGGYLCLWEWRTAMLVRKFKASSSCFAVASVSFSSDGKFVITAGKKHLKFWTIGPSPRTRLSYRTSLQAMDGKAVNLGHQKGSSFVSVISAAHTDVSILNYGHDGDFLPIYALTYAGVLCLIHSGLVIKRSISLKVDKGYALSISNKLIACACSNGIVRLFTIETLKYVGSLLYSKAKNKHSAEKEISCCAKDTQEDTQVLSSLPGAVACQFTMSEKLVVFYGDHSLYIWDIHDVDQATKCCVLVSHSGCIWDIKNLCCENMHDQSLACVARGCSGGVSFATCCADGTIRFWDLALLPVSSEDAGDCHSSLTASIGATRLVSTGTFERDAVELDASTQGFRSMAASSNGKYLAAGDCEGNLHVYNLHTFDYTCFEGAHNAEILTLSFSSKKCGGVEDLTTTSYLLASGGLDCLIHLYDAERKFDFVGSIHDHSAAVTSVKLPFGCDMVLSCGADRSLVSRDINVTDDGFNSNCRHQVATHGTIFDLAVDPKLEVVVTVGQDKKINVYDIASMKLVRSFKQEKNFGDPIKVTLDPSCSYLLCSYSNKCICIYDFITGEMITQAMGHGEIVTGVIFLPDCKHIISVGGDSCIFIWEVPAFMYSKMRQKILENYGLLSPRSIAQPVDFSQVIFCEEEDQPFSLDTEDLLLSESSNHIGKGVICQQGQPQEILEFKFSVSRLPRWAQAKVTGSHIVHRKLSLNSPQKVEPKVLSPFVCDGWKGAHFSPEPQVPSDRIRSSKACLSNFSRSSSHTNGDNSPTSEDPISSFSKGKRWLSVYTVCMDLLNSPELQDIRKAKMHVSSHKILKGISEIQSNDLKLVGHSNRAMNGENCSTLEKQACSENSTSICEYKEEIASDVAEPSNSHRPGCKLQVTSDALDNMNSEDTDLFKRYLGSLSSTHKIERGQSSIPTRNATKYVVHLDYLGGCKRLFDSPFQDLKMKKPLQSSSCFPQSESTKCSVQGNELLKSREQEQCTSEENKVQRKITACREALLTLDDAAERAFQLFSELKSLSPSEKLLVGAGPQLNLEANNMLPIIVEKVDSITKLMLCSNNVLCQKTDTSNLEALSETPMENPSHKR